MTLARYLLSTMLTSLCAMAMIFVTLQTQCYGQTSACTVLGVKLQHGPNIDTVLIELDGHPVKIDNFTLDNPHRIVIDLFDCKCQDGLVSKGSSDLVSRLRIGRHPDKVRIVADIRPINHLSHHISEDANHITLELAHNSEAPALTPPVAHELPTTHSVKKNQHQIPSLGAKNSKEEMDNSPWEENDEEQSAETPEKLPWEEGKEAKEEPAWEKEVPGEKSAFSFSGKLWNKFGFDIDEESPYEDDMSNHAELLLEGAYTPSAWFTALFSIEIQHFTYANSGHWDGDFDPDIFDAYVNFSGSFYNLRVGQQIVKWGKADEIGPLDIVNPEDFRDGPVRPRDERKLPVPMINLELFKDLYKLQAIYIPFFRKSKFDFKGDDWAFFDHYEDEMGHFQIVKDDVPKTLDNGEFGVRGSGTVRNFDYAFCYFYTRSDLPALGTMSVSHLVPLPVSDATLRKLAQLSASANQPINISYDRVSVTGFEFETTLGGFGLRGEAGYFNKISFLTNTLQKVRKPVFQYALGLDYSGQEAFYVNLQFLQSFVIDYDDDILFTRKTTSSAFGKITKGVFDDKLELGLRAYYNFSDKDYYWNPSATIKYWQNITFEVGADILGGAADTTMGLFRENDQLYGILRCFF